MSKLKTHRGAAKRFKKTATGKIKRSKAFHSHILTKKSSGRKRRLTKSADVSPGDAKVIDRMLPYL
jgi:large subunit ribosomal protein L35